MPNITNKAYVGQAGTIVLNGDTHFGVTAFGLTPTTPREQVVDISGDVQVFTGKPTWLANVAFHQDHITDGSLSRKSPEWAGTVIPFTYTPQDGGEGREGNLRWEDVPFGGDTARHSVSQAFGVVGQPTIIAPAEA
ncbi:hypothetical protein V8Z69_07510 [Microbacterium aurugineum]|uniref:hypothetical protein n=1 Tax=Microbacterium aurugineum TaxID=2851642 RepID=UPI0039BDF185